MIEKWLIILAMIVLSFGAGFIKGCSYVKQDYKDAETKFIERTKVVKQIEKVEVPVFKDRIQWLTETKYQLIEAAKNETPNPAVCDLSPDRIMRINSAITAKSP